MLLIGNVNGSYFSLKFISQLVYLLSLDLLENNLTRKQIIIDQIQIILYGFEIIIKYKLALGHWVTQHCQQLLVNNSCLCSASMLPLPTWFEEEIEQRSSEWTDDSWHSDNRWWLVQVEQWHLWKWAFRNILHKTCQLWHWLVFIWDNLQSI